MNSLEAVEIVDPNIDGHQMELLFLWVAAGLSSMMWTTMSFMNLWFIVTQCHAIAEVVLFSGIALLTSSMCLMSICLVRDCDLEYTEYVSQIRNHNR